MTAGRPLAIVDIDGVVADVRHRLHHLQTGRGRRKDWDAFFAAASDDGVHSEGLAVVERLAHDHEIVFLTGRPERLRASTEQWLDINGLGGHGLVMRPEGDRRPAATIKVELIAELSRDRTIGIVVDDDPLVLAAASTAGHPTFAADWERRSVDAEAGLREAQEIEGRT